MRYSTEKYIEAIWIEKVVQYLMEVTGLKFYFDKTSFMKDFNPRKLITFPIQTDP